MGFKAKYLLAEITGRKNRSLLTIISLALGIALWVCLTVLASGYENAASAPLRQLGTDLTIQRTQGPIPDKFEGAILPCADARIEGNEVEKLRTLPGIERMTTALLMWVFDMGIESTNDFKMVLGLDPVADFGPGVLKDGAIEGRYLNENERGMALLDEGYAVKHGIEVGETIVAASSDFQVVGIVRTPSASLFGATNVYISLADAQEIAVQAPQIQEFQQTDINLVFLKADPEQVMSLQSSIESILPGVTISTPISFLSLMGGFAEAAKRFAWAGSVIAIIAALAMTVRTSASSIWERRREIAIMKAVGWTNSNARWQLLRENLILGLTGASLGLMGSFCFIWVMNGQIITIPLPWELDPYPHFYLTESADKVLSIPLALNLSYGLSSIALLSGMAIAFITIILISKRIMKIKPAEVLRNE